MSELSTSFIFQSLQETMEISNVLKLNSGVFFFTVQGNTRVC